MIVLEQVIFPLGSTLQISTSAGEEWDDRLARTGCRLSFEVQSDSPEGKTILMSLLRDRKVLATRDFLDQQAAWLGAIRELIEEAELRR